MFTNMKHCVILGFRREVDENCALLGYYAGSSDNLLPTFRDNLSVPSSGVKDPKGSFWSLDPWRWNRRVVPKRR